MTTAVFLDGRAVGNITDADVDVLTRMVRGEGGSDASALASTIVRRWAVKEAGRGRGRTLGAFATAFSTPLHLSTPWAIQTQTMPISAIPEGLRRTVLAITSGQEPLTADPAVDWGAPSLWIRDGLDVSSEATRAATAPAAIVARETRRGTNSPVYVPTPGANPRRNVFLSDATSVGHLVTVGASTATVAATSSSSPTSSSPPTTTAPVEVPNDIQERHFSMTQNRTEAPNHQYPYFTLSSSRADQQTNHVLTEHQEQLIVKNRSDRFYDQVLALKNTTALQMSQVLPLIVIYAEDPETGDVVNLTELIFSQPTLHNMFEDSEDFESIAHSEFPERPLASVESINISVQAPNAGGSFEVTMMQMALKVHTPSLITREHPKGKFLSYMFRPGYAIRVRYGVTSEDPFDTEAFQWKEQGFSTAQYAMTANDDKSMSVQLTLTPNTTTLMRQVLVGESIPAADIGNITEEDISASIDAATDGGHLPNSQVGEIERRVRAFANQFNSTVSSPAMRTVRREDGTFGSTLQAAFRTSEILNESGGAEGVSVTIDRSIEALRSIQSLLLTRRYQRMLSQDAYRNTLPNGTTISAINCGPLLEVLIKPEIETIVGFASANNMQVGEIFSIDDARLREDSDGGRRHPRNNVSFVFGNFNERAGQWANRPISAFPINADHIFQHLRQQRLLGQFSSDVGAFFTNMSAFIEDVANYTVSRTEGDGVSYPIERPDVKFVLYPDPTTSDNWIFYVYDNKVSSVRTVRLLHFLGGQRIRRTKEQIIAKCQEYKIPWLEMGTDGNIVKTMGANTQADDRLQSHIMHQAQRSAMHLRQQDGSTIRPGIFVDFAGAQTDANDTDRVIRDSPQIIPLSVRATTFMLSTAFMQAPIYIFFPIPEFSGIFMPNTLGHTISSAQAITHMELIIQVSAANIRTT